MKRYFLFLVIVASLVFGPISPTYALFESSKQKLYFKCSYNSADTLAERDKACWEALKKFSTDDPKERETVSDIWGSLGLHAYLRHDAKNGVEYYTKSIQLTKLPDPGVFSSRGKLYMALSQYDKAIVDFKKELEETKHVAAISREAHAWLGKVYYLQHRHKEAVEHLAAGYKYFRLRRDFGIMNEFKEPTRFYGLDKWENYEAYKAGRYTPPQLASSRPAAPAQRVDRGSPSRASSAPPRDGLYRSTDPNFDMGDPSLDF